jgi:hypothetical protein
MRKQANKGCERESEARCKRHGEATPVEPSVDPACSSSSQYARRCYGCWRCQLLRRLLTVVASLICYFRLVEVLPSCQAAEQNQINKQIITKKTSKPRKKKEARTYTVAGIRTILYKRERSGRVRHGRHDLVAVRC